MHSRRFGCFERRGPRCTEREPNEYHGAETYEEGALRASYRIGQVCGTTVYADASCGVACLLMFGYLFSAFLPRLNSTWSPASRSMLALCATLALVATVLTPLWVHVYIGRVRGLRVREVTLYPFGGVFTDRWEEPRSPVDGCLVSAVGPLASVMIIGLLSLLGAYAAGRIANAAPGYPFGPAGGMSVAVALLLTLAGGNLWLALLHLLPAWPLDGGSALRAALRLASGDRRRALLRSRQVGEAAGWCLVAVGVAMLSGWRAAINVVGVPEGAIVLALGLSLVASVRASAGRVQVRDLLEGVPVSALMHGSPPAAQAELSVEGLVLSRVLGTDAVAFPVLRAGSFVGLVTLADARRVPREAWGATRVSEAMTPRDRLVACDPAEDAADAVGRLLAAGVGQLPVVRGDAVVGLLRRVDVLEWLRRSS